MQLVNFDGMKGFLCLLFMMICRASSISNYINADDLARYESLFSSQVNLKRDLVSVQYGILGMSLLGKPVLKSDEVCQYLKVSMGEQDLATLYSTSKAASVLKNCNLGISKDTLKKLQADLSTDLSIQDMFFTVSTLAASGQTIDKGHITQSLKKALKKENSPLNLGYAFHVVYLSGDEASFASFLEGAVAQADEVDGKFLQYEGGVGITSIVLTGIYQLSEKVNKKPPVSEEQVIKFASYFVDRKGIQSVKGAYHLIAALKMLSANKFHIPVAISLQSHMVISSGNPSVELRITNLMGEALPSMTLLADSVTRNHGDVVVISKQLFVQDVKDKSMYSLNMMASSPGRGFYNLITSAKPTKPDARYIGHINTHIQVKVLTEVTVESVELSIADADESMAPRIVKLTSFNKFADVLEADVHQHLVVHFTLTDRLASTSMRCHQSFVRLVDLKTGLETLVVVPHTAQDEYKLDMAVTTLGKRLGGASGVYRLELLVGDAVISNSFTWQLADLRLKLSTEVGIDTLDLYAVRPSIVHQFRAAEPRPSTAVSNLFTLLLLLPLLVMVVGWFRIGLNISNFPISLSTLGFLAGLGCIFTLYFYFWLQLNMFTTFKYLMGLGIVTFLCGHDALARLAKLRKMQHT